MKLNINTRNRRMVYSALLLALCLVLPFFTGQIPQVGNALCPMHLPVFLAGFFCGPSWAALVGIAAPPLRHVLFGMPPLLTAIAMCFELCTYGFLSGYLYRKLPHSKFSVYISLIAAMIGGRAVWGIVRILMTGVSGEPFTWAIFLAGAFTTAIPGIVLQLILIPMIVSALKPSK